MMRIYKNRVVRNSYLQLSLQERELVIRWKNPFVQNLRLVNNRQGTIPNGITSILDYQTVYILLEEIFRVEAWNNTFVPFFTLTHGQSEKEEEKPATPEVSNPALSPSCTPSKNALRRRKTATKAQPKQTPVLPFCRDDVSTSLERKSIKYPNILADKAPPKMGKPLPKLTKPPPLQSAVFLKCDTKREDKDKMGPSEGPKVTTDLDVQLRRLKLTALGMSSSSSDSERRPSSASEDTGQSLGQYCNFDEKKVVKVAPHIRRKDVICDTVDAWSKDTVVGDNARYKPLVFGGTYPIDLPLDAVRNKSVALARKTYDIDAPFCCE